MKNTILLIVLFLLPLNAYAFVNEPDGFRDIKWGTFANTIEDIELKSGMIYFVNGISTYKIRSEPLVIGDAKVNAIEYTFLDNKFGLGTVEINGIHCTFFKDLFIASFGSPSRIEPDPVRIVYSWDGSKSEILLSCDSYGGIFFIQSSEYKKELQIKVSESRKRKLKKALDDL
ncbi:hypothetical protein ACFL4R_01750 [Nitrospirota bacterium]